ncbi:MAG TPA: hypothetical protein VF173_16840 [Thermoanaerobaculia bacterium]|nr:hypothetical protein [Thermoanaerobaculia bacterium]
MKRTLVVAAILLFTASLAWAEVPPGGGCMLPNLAGLSPEQAAAAAFAAGFETSTAVNAAVQPCATPFQCSSIGNCAAGPLCGITDIGQCCSIGGGTLCCASGGTIKVVTCPCQCTSRLCSLACVNSSDVSMFCS